MSALIQSNEEGAKMSTVTLNDLDNLTSMEALKDGHGHPLKDGRGNQIYRDRAQIKTGQYFNFCLADALQKPWQEKIYGVEFSLTDGVRKVYTDHQKFFQDHAVLAAGQMLYNNMKDKPSRAELEKRIKVDALKEGWKKLGKDKSIAPEYAEICQKLYLEGYRDSVVGIQPYFEDDAPAWAKVYFDYLTSQDVLERWQTRLSGAGSDQIHHMMYQWYVKLLILDPTKDYARRFLSIAYAAFFNVSMTNAKWQVAIKPFVKEILENIRDGHVTFPGYKQGDSKIYKEVVDKLIEVFNSVDTLTNQISAELTQWQEKKGNRGIPFAEAGDDVLEGLRNLYENDSEKQGLFDQIKKTGGQLLKAVFAGAAVGFLIFSIVDSSKGKLDAKAIVSQIGMGGLAIGLLVKGTQQVMSLGVGEWLHNQAKISDGFMAEAAESIASWFEKGSDVVKPTGRLGEALLGIFGKDYTEFLSKRLAPAMAVFGMVMSAWGLAEAIKSGNVREIVFDSLNTFFSVSDSLLMGLEMASVSWAGAVGSGFAVVGLLVGLIQFIWGSHSCPKAAA